MEESIVIVIGASPLAEEVRRRLVQRQTAHAGVTGHLRGLRKRLAVGPASMVVVFVAGDGATIRRYGPSLRRLLDDRWAFGSGILSIGLLENRSLSAAAASLGCDVYVSSAASAMRLMTMCRRRAARRYRKVNRMRAIAARSTARVNRLEGLVERKAIASGESGSA